MSQKNQKASDKEQTPMMRQYWEMKNIHTDKVLLFRMGDFFEMFFDDAVKAAPILGIALTSRNKKSGDEAPMCGVPHHSIGGQINKLLAAGLKVAICDQLEDPKAAKGIVKRGVTRILTPGMVYDADTLDASSANYLGSLDDKSLSLVDASTGEALIFSGIKEADLLNLLRSLPLAELVVAPGTQALMGESLEALKSSDLKHLLISEHAEIFEDEILIGDATGFKSAGRLLSYMKSLGGDKALELLRPFQRRELQGRLEMSPTVLRSLEIFETQRGDREGTLFTAINRTKTSMGARLLRARLAFPWADAMSVTKAWDQVDLWLRRSAEMKLLRERLFDVGDIERRLTRLSPSTANARDLRSLGSSLMAAMDVFDLLRSPVPKVPEFENLCALLGQETEIKVRDFARKVDASLLDELPLSTKQGYMIRDGLSPELDEAIRFSTNGQEMLQAFETREKEATGVPSLKVRYNNVFGYYIEISNTHRDKAPKHYMRKQTLVNAERFTTEELIELEKKILSAQGRRFDLESAYFEGLRSEALEMSSCLLALAHLLAEMDVSLSWASLARERDYVRPKISEDGRLRIASSRHPVVEQKLGSSFSPNDVEISQGHCILLTGPNMAGKSTLMRQVALTSVLAQSGGYVPAASAELPIFDRIFTRIGANDSLAEGLSTFMVEMKEAAEIVKGMTDRSLIILDEIGRGTSTYDGMSLAQALLEHLLSQKSGYLFFATHYHELTLLETHHKEVKNAHMSVADDGTDLRFLYSLREGPAQKSYGIHVAKLAGMPTSLTDRANELLSAHEAAGGAATGEALPAVVLEPKKKPKTDSPQLSLFGEDSALREELDRVQAELSRVTKLVEKHKTFSQEVGEIEIHNMTGLQALVRIEEWQSKLKGSKAESVKQ